MAQAHNPSDEQVWQAIAAERRRLVELLAALPDSDWNRDSLCAGWRVREVVAHVVISSGSSTSWLLWQLVRARGSIDRLNHDTAVRLARQVSTAELLDLLRDRIDTRFTPIRTTPTDRLMDLLVHGQDIAVPLGLSHEIPAEPARWSLHRLWTMGWPFHAERQLAGYRLSATDTDWRVGEGTLIAARASTLLLLLTGRITPTVLVGD
ncbi:maleylpyruvate isomerase family mycothiol-dependent enzyme [Nocardia cyriacigeorgica]|uniref:Maleylpyruvate isomerase family mycothiol-dependent enzyme n=1 Tax=Nocardia cyriacigeorgica TaxID=135487 RepID=A0A6P1DGC2_9NOCA|nr:maleylpyruvate isomerase family mycothiol-dependent enzyme [Nocardia cyriacigeorgica]NEW37934.1 maleylpyruvate isomerase family mycothiol-dependent enzyme [Nocardia cyriacigeorgica]NEW47432.1 maleylpyruvate isomerase family mycothiol-dependent enzyme [Nocardia cyriacigeorgica]NEW48683.1 maleylpyruvate isomerase family mycothiol-dependent enzyme [Nocardia cyriacigeorgica]NEW56401.1 maleylpyruvate isomerase family mycothiol-dependent enzyme [Nocardia cyriacigeorgica]